jgi:hypothetical protein
VKLSEFTKDMRVELAPYLDLWMQGARYGAVNDTTGRKYVHVKLDRTGKVVSILPGDLMPIREHVPVITPKMRSTKFASPEPVPPGKPNHHTRRIQRRASGADFGLMGLFG